MATRANSSSARVVTWPRPACCCCCCCCGWWRWWWCWCWWCGGGRRRLTVALIGAGSLCSSAAAADRGSRTAWPPAGFSPAATGVVSRGLLLAGGRQRERILALLGGLRPKPNPMPTGVGFILVRWRPLPGCFFFFWFPVFGVLGFFGLVTPNTRLVVRFGPPLFTLWSLLEGSLARISFFIYFSAGCCFNEISEKLTRLILGKWFRSYFFFAFRRRGRRHFKEQLIKFKIPFALLLASPPELFCLWKIIVGCLAHARSLAPHLALFLSF